MKLNSMNIYRYDIPLVRPLKMMGSYLEKRSGYILSLQDKDGTCGYGEIAPFPGLHRESLDTILPHIHSLKSELIGMSLSFDLLEMNGLFDDWLRPLNVYPTVRCGIEMAVLDLLAAKTEKSIPDLLFTHYRDSVHLNGLVVGSLRDVRKETQNLVREGYQSIKLKVGRQELEYEIDMVKQVRSVIGENVALRLDANRSWSLKEALLFGLSVADNNIEYIEEPCREQKDLAEFYSKTGIPVALDETANDISMHDFKIPPGTKAFILKPSVLGSLERTVLLARFLEKRGVMPVLSSAFESGLALSIYAQLAAGMTKQDISVGLDTYKWLQEDILDKPFFAKSGKVNVQNCSRICHSLRFDKFVKLSQVVHENKK